ncbi:MAG: DUF2079 domain-containing protein [Chloroflexi bacterium]|nr:DUF2079 domain-containing protein [Chloroflexota bacterium]
MTKQPPRTGPHLPPSTPQALAPPLARPGDQRAEARFWTAALLLGLSAAAVFAALGLVRIAALQTNTYDFAFFDQLLWNTAHGRFLDNSFVAYPFLAQHVEFAFLLLVPLYWLGAGPEALLLFQAAGVGLAVPALAGCARALTGNRLVALTAALAFVLSPYLHRAMAFDFHPETMTAGLVFGAVWAAARERRRLAFGLGAGALTFKEDQAFTALTLGGLFLLWTAQRPLRRRGDLRAVAALLRSPAAALMALGLVWAIGVVLIIQPALRGGAPSDLAERFGYLGGDARTILLTALTQPGTVRDHLVDNGALAALLQAVVVTAPAALAFPAALLLPLPHLLLASLSAHAPQMVFGLHYGAAMLPLLTVAQLLALRLLPDRRRPPPALLALALAAAVSLSAEPLRPAAWPTPRPEALQALAAAARLVPPGDAVSAQSNLGIAFARRRRLYEFPALWDNRAEAVWDAEWAALDRYGHVSTQARAMGYDQMRERLPNLGFVKVFDEQGIELYHCAGCATGRR